MNNSIIAALALLMLTVLIVGVFPYDDERGILKWNPYWFSNFRYSAPSTYYSSIGRGFPYKRLSQASDNQIYKWSPVYFTGTPWKQPSVYQASNSFNQASEVYDDPDEIK